MYLRRRTNVFWLEIRVAALQVIIVVIVIILETKNREKT